MEIEKWNPSLALPTGADSDGATPAPPLEGRLGAVATAMVVVVVTQVVTQAGGGGDGGGRW